MQHNKIAIHTDELDTLGVKIEPIQEWDKIVLGVHRDDHYMFIIQQQGTFVLELDFNSVMLRGPSIGFVTPGQVHRYIDQKKGKGWFIFVDSKWVTAQYREIFDTFLNIRQFVPVMKDNEIFILTTELEKLRNRKNMSLQKDVLQSFIQTIVGMIASYILQAQEKEKSTSRSKYALVLKFKQLIKDRYKEYKQVKDYASQLNITPLYLNEVVGKVTGFPASYWIHQEIILEAKRLLYYTDLSIMEIAYELGYDDHTYFSRFFKKNAGMTATVFRDENRSSLIP